ncbi:MAG: hypothetical protein ACRD1L_10640 [Terriglobales bacterium]
MLAHALAAPQRDPEIARLIQAWWRQPRRRRELAAELALAARDAYLR